MAFDPVRIGDTTDGSNNNNQNVNNGGATGQGRPNITSTPYNDLFYGLAGLGLENLQNTSFENSEFASAFQHEGRALLPRPGIAQPESIVAASRPLNLEEIEAREDFESVDDDSQFGPDDAENTSQSSRANERPKKKRFRLTHLQTRLLLNEFARAPHPDASHRERLAREIPGMSPRQVQVWFQNRRAKLRRMQNSDREKAMHYEGKFSDVQGVSVPRTDISLPSYPHSLSTHSSIANLPTLPSIPQARPQHPPPPYQYPPYPYSIDPPSSPPTVEYRQPNNPSAPPPWDGGFYYKQI